MSTFSMTESEVTEWWIRSDDLQQEPQTVQPPQKKARPSNEPSNVPWCGEAGTGGSVASGASKVVLTAARISQGDRNARAEGVNFLAYGTYTDYPARGTADCRCGALPLQVCCKSNDQGAAPIKHYHYLLLPTTYLPALIAFIAFIALIALTL